VDQVIWVEILSRHRDVTARFRLTGPQVRIGRAYDNDVVIDDPYVAGHHMRVVRDDEGRLVAEDSGSANGMLLDRDRTGLKRIMLDGERPIRIGHTLIRIRDASHTVPHERAIGRPAGPFLLVLLTVLGLAIVGIELMSAWFTETGEPRLSHYLMPLVYIGGAVVCWVTIWAVATRIVTGRAGFTRHLLIALSGVLVYSLYNDFAQFAAFALTWRAPSGYDYVAMWCIAAAICFLHLRQVGTSATLVKAATVTALLAVAIALHTLIRVEAFQESGRPNTTYRLMPPALRLAPVHDANVFFSEVDQLRADLDRDRSEAGR